MTDGVSSKGTARRAVIDVGTNSIKVLVADIQGLQVTPVWESSEQTRLGQGLYHSNRLQSGPVARTAQAVSLFLEKALKLRAESVRIIATSAVRDALNPSELLLALAAHTHLPVEVLSGEQEAELAYRGATTDPNMAGMKLLLLDLGGGSTEFILGEAGNVVFSESFPLGAIRLLEHVPHSDPPTLQEKEAARSWVEQYLKFHVREKVVGRLNSRSEAGQETHLVGTGGTATILARMEAGIDSYDREKIEGQRISFERMSWFVERLWGMRLEERQLWKGLPPQRADIILTGALIYQEIMRVLGFQELRVSTRGLRFAAVLGPGTGKLPA